MIEKYKHINVNPWQFNKQYPVAADFDIKLACGSLLCECWVCGENTIAWVTPSIPCQEGVYFSFEDESILGWRLSV